MWIRHISLYIGLINYNDTPTPSIIPLRKNTKYNYLLLEIWFGCIGESVRSRVCVKVGMFNGAFSSRTELSRKLSSPSLLSTARASYCPKNNINTENDIDMHEDEPSERFRLYLFYIYSKNTPINSEKSSKLFLDYQEKWSKDKQAT